jgi:hypothetical protein
MDTIHAISDKVLGKHKVDGAVAQPDKINIIAGSAESYVEQDPSVGQWLREQAPGGNQILQYLVSLFPFSQWIFSYNLQWLIGDLVAGTPAGFPFKLQQLTGVHQASQWVWSSSRKGWHMQN